MRFGIYAPQNLDRTWLGPITARMALQASRNLPAVALLDAVGPAQLFARLRRPASRPCCPPGGAPGLAIALGGVGLTLEDLVRLYAAIARGGEPSPLVRTRPDAAAGAPARRVLDPVAAWYVADILRRHAAARRTAPAGRSPSRPARATATATPGRSASTARTSIGVWFGRPDGAAGPRRPRPRRRRAAALRRLRPPLARSRARCRRRRPRRLTVTTAAAAGAAAALPRRAARPTPAAARRSPSRPTAPASTSASPAAPASRSRSASAPARRPSAGSSTARRSPRRPLRPAGRMAPGRRRLRRPRRHRRHRPRGPGQRVPAVRPGRDGCCSVRKERRTL